MRRFESPRDYLESIEANETTAEEQLAVQLEPWRVPVGLLLACAVSTPVENGEASRRCGPRVSALFIRRAINDLWVVWRLLKQGYTPQAASVASSAFESALVAFSLESHDDRADKLWYSRDRKVPWKVRQLCDWTQEELLAHGLEVLKEEGRNLSTLLYTEYQWLCKYKHPTVPSALHDAMSVDPGAKDPEARISFSIQVGQDYRRVDLPNKSMVLFITMQLIYTAMYWAAETEGLRWPDDYTAEWCITMGGLPKLVCQAFEACEGPVAFDSAGFIPLGYQGHGFALGDQDRQG